MSLPTQTLDSIVTRSRAYFRTQFAGFPMGLQQFFGHVSQALGLNVWSFHKAVEDLDQDIVPNSHSSNDMLSAWAALLGLPDGQGGYGRLKPTTSSGGLSTLTGTKGTIYPDAAIATAEDGVTQIKLSGSVTIAGAAPGTGSISGAFVGVTTGTVGNLAVGTVCTWQSAPAGADPTFTLTSALGGAVDAESNPAVYARIVQRLQTPPRGGVSEDYRLWAETATGIFNVYVYPRRSGTGSVDVVCATGGTGIGRVATANEITAAAAAILAKRPAAVDGVNTLAPTTTTGHLVRVRVTPSQTKYNFDWDDTATPYTVDTYTSGASATLKFNTLAPASLKAAIDAYIAGTGPQPRLQVLSTGSVINVPVGTSKTISWSDGGGKTTITLDTLPSTWIAPTAGDKVYAYGPAVATIAAGCLAFADSLGPSLVSGYGDPLSPWFDKLTISGIIRIAEDAIDFDGTRLIKEVPVGFATIDGVAADVEGADANVDGTGPEILFLSHVAVTA